MSNYVGCEFTRFAWPSNSAIWWRHNPKGQRKSTPLSLSGYQLLEAWITISLRLPFNNIVRQKNQFSVTQVCWLVLVWRCTPNFWPAARPLPAAPPPGGGVILHSHKRQHYYANNMLCQLGRGGGGSRQYQGMQFMYDCKILQLQSYVPTANRIIGQSQSTKIDANNVLPSFMMRLSSRTRQQRRTVPFASYQCQYNCYVVLHFHPQLY